MSRERDLLKRVLTSELWSVQEELQSEIRQLLAEPKQENDYAWSSVAEYEKDVGFSVSQDFKIAWDMARTRLSNTLTPAAQPALEPAPEPIAWMYKWKENYEKYSTHFKLGVNPPSVCTFSMRNLQPLYTAPSKREPPITSREMYQRGYAAAERDLKREPLSDDEVIVPEWMIAHPHAEIIMKYAEVAARRIDPWVEFEWFDGCIVEWVKCKDTMCFNFDKYRHIGDNS
jgi:hypothetical protein